MERGGVGWGGVAWGRVSNVVANGMVCAGDDVFSNVVANGMDCAGDDVFAVERAIAVKSWENRLLLFWGGCSL